jgi:hypothetical protein
MLGQILGQITLPNSDLLRPSAQGAERVTMRR